MPRSARLLAPWVGSPGAQSALYHCLSRVVDRQRLFGPVEKEEFVRLMRLYERFCGVHVLDYCVMSNHFHLLLEVPPRLEGTISDEELFERLALIKREAEVEELREQLARLRRGGLDDEVEQFRERFLYRMWNLSEFMKSLKQCFTTWYNKRHDRCGTLWESRFKSPLVEDGYAARVLGAYIDLNPIRAGIVKRPEDYRWCGYGEAMRGGKQAQAGIARLMAHHEKLGGIGGERKAWQEVAAAYREILYHDGEERHEEDPRTGRVTVARRGMTRQEVERVLQRGGKLSAADMLRCRVRAFSDGAVIGTRKFLENFFTARPDFFGPKRKSGACPVRGCETELCCARDLRKDALGLRAPPPPLS